MGRTETLAEDMARLAEHACEHHPPLRRLRALQRRPMAAGSLAQAPPSEACPLASWAEQVASSMKNERDGEPRSKLSDVGVLALCTSDLYGGDAAAYGYRCEKRGYLGAHAHAWGVKGEEKAKQKQKQQQQKQQQQQQQQQEKQQEKKQEKREQEEREQEQEMQQQ